MRAHLLHAPTGARRRGAGLPIAALLAATALGAAACGSEDAAPPASTAAQSTPAAATSEAPSAATSAATADSQTATSEAAATTAAAVADEATDERLRLVTDWLPESYPDPAPDYALLAFGEAELLLKPSFDGPQPWLAESVEPVSATVWRITLADGTRFQNGKPLDAAALKAYFAWEFEHDEGSKGIMGDPTGIEVVDDRTVEVTLPKPFPSFRNALSLYTWEVYDAEAVAAAGGSYEKLVGAGVFTGPFMTTKIENDRWTIDRDADWWGGTAALAGIDATRLTDPQTGLKAVANGDADVMMTPPVSLKRTARSYPDVEYRVADTALVYAGFNLNPQKAPFDDKRVRQAFAAAIDAAAISSSTMLDVWRPLGGIFPESWDEAVTWRAYDPARATALLDEAGWTAGDDGVRVKGGERLATTIITYSDDLESVGTAALDMLRKVGFDAKLKRVPDYSSIPELLPKDGDPVNAQLMNLESFGLNYDPYLTTCRNFQTDKGYNLVIRDADAQALCATALGDDEAAAKDAFRRLQELNGDEAYYIPVLDEPNTMIVGPRYRGLAVDPWYIFYGPETRPTT